MNRVVQTTVLAFSMIVGPLPAATPTELIVREVINADAAPTSSSVGRNIANSSFQTPAGSRVHLSWGKENALRLGSDTIVHADASASRVTLQQGSLLFENAKDGREVVIQKDGKEISIRGGTGFVSQADDNAGARTLVIGALSGTIVVNSDGASHRLRVGELFAQSASGRSVIANFDLEKQANTSLLLQDFTSRLLTQDRIERETKRFVAMRERGFVRDFDSADVRLSRAASLALESGIGTLARAEGRTIPTRTERLDPPGRTQFPWFGTPDPVTGELRRESVTVPSPLVPTVLQPQVETLIPTPPIPSTTSLGVMTTGRRVLSGSGRLMIQHHEFTPSAGMLTLTSTTAYQVTDLKLGTIGDAVSLGDGRITIQADQTRDRPVEPRNAR